MNYLTIRKRPSQFISLTGLHVEEFDYLIPTFHGLWRNYYRIHTIEGKKRQTVLTNPMKDTPRLATLHEKLFFILVYLKNHSLQEMMAASFGFTQSQASNGHYIIS